MSEVHVAVAFIGAAVDPSLELTTGALGHFGVELEEFDVSDKHDVHEVTRVQSTNVPAVFLSGFVAKIPHILAFVTCVFERFGVVVNDYLDLFE